MDDLISRQAAIDALWKALYEYEDKTEKQFQESEDLDIEDWIVHRIFAQDMSAEDMQAIIDLPPAQQWIPCSERLPENEDIYLVTFDKSNLLDNETQVTDAYWINNQWQYGVLESYEHRMPKLVVEPIEELKVIAWMPFPEPYKGEES